MSSSNLSKSKLTIPVGLSTPKNNRLRSELRRVMSDRVLKITRCSQQQNVEKIKQRLDGSLLNNNNTPSTPTVPTSQTSESHLVNSDLEKLKQNKSPLISPTTALSITKPAITNISPNLVHYRQIAIGKELSPRYLAKIPINAKTSPVDSNDPNAKLATNKISLQPIKTFDLKDKESLIKHILCAYNDVLDSNGSIILAVQSIVNSIQHYLKANNLDIKASLGDILKENLFKSNIDLKQKYKNDEQIENFKLEGQIQVLLQIENYIVSNNNTNCNKVKVDEDWVWEIANSIRWLKQTFKDFKIERFLFGEIYANYFQNASDFIVSLMEELGYDKDENAESSSNSPNGTPMKKPALPLNDSNSEQSTTAKDTIPLSSSSKFLAQLSHSNSNQALNHLREDSNSNYSFTGGVNSLFEDEYPERSNNNNDSDLNDNDEQSQNTHNLDDSDKLLGDLKKKKPAARFSDFSQSSARSIVVQRKRMRLKIRSPYKSPSKSFQNKRLISTNAENSRRSPRIKERQTIFSVDATTSQKRPRTYLITDTPDHKQNATIITTRQEKLRKRFSFQQFNSPNTSLPIVPDTPVKSENLNATDLNQDFGAASSNAAISMRKVYASPKKAIKSVLFR